MKILDWLHRHWQQVVWAVGGLLVGGAIGWWAGSWTSCSRSATGCEVRWESIEAVGTWVGGGGTILAVVAAVVAFRGEERARLLQMEREQKDRDQALERARQDANQVTIDGQVGGYSGEMVDELRVHVRNRTANTTLYKLTGDSEDLGRLVNAQSLAAGKLSSTSFRFGAQNQPPRRKIPEAERKEYTREMAEQVVIEFQMHDRIWRRRGSQPVELIGDAPGGQQ